MGDETEDVDDEDEVYGLAVYILASDEALEDLDTEENAVSLARAIQKAIDSWIEERE
jgi:hypothetical protein